MPSTHTIGASGDPQPGDALPEPASNAAREDDSAILSRVGLRRESTPPDVILALETLQRVKDGEHVSAEDLESVQRTLANETLALEAIRRMAKSPHGKEE